MLTCALIFESQFVAPVLAQSNGDVVGGWSVKNQGGYYSESNGTIRIWSDAHDQGVILYKEISPKSDSEFSLQVKAARMDGFGIVIGDIDTGRQMNFEFHNKYGTNTFLLARAVKETNWETGVYGTYWDWQGFACGQENVWYTMKLTVKAEPFVVTGQVYSENGTLLGKLSLSDMENFQFKDIQNVEIMNPWGGDYYVRNISNITDISSNTDTSDVISNNNGSDTEGLMQSQITITPEVSSTILSTPINIKGKLADSNGSSITNENVILSYSFPGINGWLPISSAYTDASGEYAIQWANTATGCFSLKVQWNGNTTCLGCSNTTTVNILPYKDSSVFFVQSNSTVTALSFNSTSLELAFSVTGPSGTRGYTQVTIDNSLISNPENLQVKLDGKELDYTIMQLDNSWVITLNYSHSTHEINMQLQASQQTEIGQNYLLLTGVILAVFFAVLIGLILVLRNKKNCAIKSLEG